MAGADFIDELLKRIDLASPSWTGRRNRCFEVAELAFDVAQELGLPAEWHVGAAMAVPDWIYPHAWTVVADVAVHATGWHGDVFTIQLLPSERTHGPGARGSHITTAVWLT